MRSVRTTPRPRPAPVARAARLLVLVGLVTTAACAGAAVDSTPKSGGPDDPVVLVLTNNDSGGNTETAPAIARFVDRVAEVSDGRLVVRVEADPLAWATDGREVTAVARGEADLGWVGTRALDLLGIDTFRPLHAPLLVDGYHAQAAVVHDRVADDVLAGLTDLGVEPLALLADELRFPASARRPLLTPDDWAGARFWVLESHAYTEAVEALGAEPLNTFATGGDVRQMAQEGELDGLETMWVYYALGADYLYSPYVVPNVSLGPRTLALFASPATLDRLDEEERGWLREAAEDTVAWSAGHADDRVAERMADACRHGARVALATPDQLRALAQAAAPLHDRLRTDPATADVMARVEALAAGAPDDPPLEVPADCRYTAGEERRRPVASRALTGPGSTEGFPTGTYRYVVPADAIVRGQDTLARPEMAGVYTWELGDGEWELRARPDAAGVAPVTCWGWYDVDGDTVRFTHTIEPVAGHCLPLVWSARWSPTDSGIRWHGPVPAVLDPHQGGVTWERIG